MARAARQDQTSIYETTIEDEELEKLLERRHALREEAATARKRAAEVDTAAKVRIELLDLADAPVRVGRFVIRRTAVAARSVAFETDPTSRLSIKLLDD